MKRIFLDTNILVDLLSDRQPFSKFAVKILELAEKNKVKLYTSSHSIATTHYLLKKFISENSLRLALTQLLEFITVIPVDVDILKKGLKSNHKDFEDSVQIFCAHTIDKIYCIVTRNIRDFKNSEVEVYSPEQIIELI